jgi:predicted secreted acid phosphatase
MKLIVCIGAVAALFVLSTNSSLAAPTYALNGPVPNLHNVQTAIVSYYESGRHDADVAKVTKQLEIAVDSERRQTVKPAVVFDIDDTALSTFPYERSHEFAFDVASWTAWEQADRFPPIEPTLRLALHLRAEGVAVFFVTGRRTPERDVTLHELARAGYPTPTGLYLRPLKDKERSVIPFKSSARALIEARGYHILASIGDQWSDLLGGHASRLYKLPNPMYYLP